MMITEVILRAKKQMERVPVTQESIQFGWYTTVIWNQDSEHVSGSNNPMHLMQYIVDFRLIKKGRNYVWEYWKTKYFNQKAYKWTDETHWQILHQAGESIQTRIF